MVLFTVGLTEFYHEFFLPAVAPAGLQCLQKKFCVYCKQIFKSAEFAWKHVTADEKFDMTLNTIDIGRVEGNFDTAQILKITRNTKTLFV